MNSKNIPIGKKQLWYIDAGAGEVVLFLHGWGITPYSYAENIASLSAHFRVIAPFYRPFLYPKQHLPMVLEHFLQQLGIRKAIVIGHSASGIWALDFAKTYPGRVKGVVLIDSLGVDTRHSVVSWLGTWGYHVMHLFQQAKQSPNFWGLVQDFLSQVITYPSTLLYEIEQALGEDIAAVLSQTATPLLILWGKHDDLTPVEEAFMMKRLSRHATLAVISGNHDWLKHHPEKLTEKVVQFEKHL